MAILGPRVRLGWLATATGASILGSIPLAVAATQADITPRILAQQGLAIAFDSTVLQSQLLVFQYAAKRTKCVTLPSGGSVETTSVSKVPPTAIRSHITIYFDQACKLPFIEATADIGAAIGVTEKYVGLHGEALGTLSLSDSYTFTFPVTLSALGTFQPANGAPAVGLGVMGTLPAGQTGSKFTVAGGIAQTFPKLNLSLASVAPLTLTETVSSAATSVTFVGRTSTRRTGAPGSLSITMPTATSLSIGGGGAADGSAATKGSAANFVLFPPTPTGWTITDAAHDARFKLQVASDTTRSSNAQVTSISTGAVLATIAVDQSGTGSIVYADGSRAAVTAWLLAD